jgi:hypothetical protein
MPNVIQAARDKLAALTRTAFGLGSGTLMDVMTAERVNWRKLMDQVEKDATAEGIEPPYGVLAFSPARRTDLALNSISRTFDVRAIYVASMRDGSAQKTAAEAREEIEDALIALETAIYGLSTGELQAWDATIDLDHSNPPNAYYAKFNLPLYAGILHVPVMVGKA